MVAKELGGKLCDAGFNALVNDMVDWKKNDFDSVPVLIIISSSTGTVIHQKMLRECFVL